MLIHDDLYIVFTVLFGIIQTKAKFLSFFLLLFSCLLPRRNDLSHLDLANQKKEQGRVMDAVFFYVLLALYTLFLLFYCFILYFQYLLIDFLYDLMYNIYVIKYLKYLGLAIFSSFLPR